MMIAAPCTRGETPIEVPQQRTEPPTIEDVLIGALHAFVAADTDDVRDTLRTALEAFVAEVSR